MKVMHLADLHLGKSVLEQSMIEDQKYILKEIVDIIQKKQVDVVLIAGDIYDKSVPTIEAVSLFSNFLSRLYRLGIKVLVISGNHDSRERLIFGNELLVDNGVYIEGIFQGKLRKVTFEDGYGKINFYMLPFVKPADVRGYYSDREIVSYQDAMACIMEDTRIDKNERNVILIHQFVTAHGVEVERSDSEILSLGGIDNIDVSLFNEFDYVAMGHIHGAQKLISDTIRYAGSPLKYSFSEVHQRKSVPVIEFGNKGDIDLELVMLKPIHDMRVIQGKLEQLISPEIYTLGNVDDYILVILTDDDYIMDALGKLRRIYKNVLRLEYKNKRSDVYFLNDDSVYEDIQKKSELGLFLEFYKSQNHVEMDEIRRGIIEDIICSLQENK